MDDIKTEHYHKNVKHDHPGGNTQHSHQPGGLGWNTGYRRSVPLGLDKSVFPGLDKKDSGTIPVDRGHDSEGEVMKVVWTLVGIVVLVMLAYFGYHAWYVDTHCTEILGTQVCQSQSG